VAAHEGVAEPDKILHLLLGVEPHNEWGGGLTFRCGPSPFGRFKGQGMNWCHGCNRDMEHGHKVEMRRLSQHMHLRRQGQGVPGDSQLAGSDSPSQEF
jgi:hypothetical protein